MRERLIYGEPQSSRPSVTWKVGGPWGGERDPPPPPTLPYSCIRHWQRSITDHSAACYIASLTFKVHVCPVGAQRQTDTLFTQNLTNKFHSPRPSIWSWCPTHHAVKKTSQIRQSLKKNCLTVHHCQIGHACCQSLSPMPQLGFRLSLPHVLI